ncbi:hypothetical protein B0O80DRAFT_263818 [Mortierella sp. GBAus27b]|nr:hypothetical protein B0O80DRAFT_263818 [Mortierella sp. GBAus27b]
MNLARQGKVPLVEMAGYRGTWDEIHGDRFNQDVRTVAEDLIEYMHANPVQEPSRQNAFTSDDLTEEEGAVLRDSTQDLTGFGNPEYDDSSDSDDDNVPRKRAPESKKRPSEKVSPPLPGFGNPLFEKETASTEPTLMARLVDRLQDMTAPPPPMAMRTAYRQQEQRRQKLFVGEYSMREDNSGTHSGGPNDGRVTVMGTNPFRRSTRIQGMVAGGWGEKKATDVSGSGAGQNTAITSRVFPLARSGSRMMSFRNVTSETVYGLAQHIQTNLVRSSSPSGKDSEGYGDLLGGTFTPPPLPKGNVTESDQLVLFWGTAKDICDVVLDALKQEQKTSSLVDPFEETANLKASQGLSVLTGLVRDMIAWIEQEDWERRLRYLFVLDALLAHPEISSQLLGCSSIPVLLEALAGTTCGQAPQRSLRDLSAHVSGVFDGDSYA